MWASGEIGEGYGRSASATGDRQAPRAIGKRHGRSLLSAPKF
ncbi:MULTISPECIES: hypothetical protein [unclassified Microcoleus]|nr:MULTISPECIES: hypothetical protein [unclassified Microcoleus]